MGMLYSRLIVSIHALLAECDHNGQSAKNRANTFQSTHSLRSATVHEHHIGMAAVVSIHALLAECDASNINENYFLSRFNPRTPCGVRPALERLIDYRHQFQSTHSLRSATLMPLPRYVGI